MKKFVAVVLTALVIALALWVALRVQQARQERTVAEFLPQTTLLLAQVGDFNQTRAQWHGSDLYAIWSEPAVQAWLRKPLAKLPPDRGGRKMLEEFLQLGPKHGFVALTSIENNEPKLIGGFHFDRSQEDARRFIEAREAPLLAKAGGVQREKIEYEKHSIESMKMGRFVLASVYDRNWFFAANDLGSLKALLDRVDRRAEKNGSLQKNEIFNTAEKQFSAEHAGMFFFNPQPFLEKLMPLIAMTGQSISSEQWQRLKQVRSVAGTLGFDQGKLREAIFVAMPRQDPEEKLTRRSLGTASKNTFFYSASLTHWPSSWYFPVAGPRPVLPPFVQRIADALAHHGISQADLRAAFGDELELLGDWAPEARWPTLTATLPVKDGVRARKIADALTSVDLASMAWTKSEKDGVTFYGTPGFGGFVPISPTLAISDQMLIAGSDSVAVETAVTRKTPSTEELEKSATFREAAARLPAADSGFDYIDTRLLFERADALARPLLLLSATAYPALGNKIDASKLPPPDAIAKHLSPIVLSQRYTGDGYLNESIGPITFNEAVIGLAGAFAGAYAYLQHGLKAGGQFLQNVAHPDVPTQTSAATTAATPP